LAAVCAGGDTLADEPSAVTIRAGGEVSFYQDTQATTVVTPTAFAGVEHVLGGWGVAGSVTVDVVSTASADIVSTASTRWTEVRVAPAIHGHHRFGDADITARSSLSTEPDYLSIANGVTVAWDLDDKRVTPSISYDLIHDVAGRTETPFSLFSRVIDTHALNLGVTLVMDRSTVFVPSLSAYFDVGDTSNPYRFIPMFDPSAARKVGEGMSAAALAPIRLDVAPLEQVPTSRQRFALDGLVLHRFRQSTLRLEERLYVDSWGLKASSSDGKLFFDVSDRVRIGAHLRLHAQTGVAFWRLAYVAYSTSAGLEVPALRAGGSVLGPFFTPTEGLALRLGISRARDVALSFTTDVAETRFFDSLYLTERLSALGSVTLEAVF
jgi:hypothetical protein